MKTNRMNPVIQTAFLAALCGAMLSGCTPRTEAIENQAASKAAPDKGLQAVPPVPKEFNATWHNDAVWNDGKAEVAHYDAERTIYNKVRRYDYVYITVKEDFNAEFLTKTDSYERTDLITAFKLNAFARIETDNYPYHFLTSLFVYKENPTAVFKLATSSQEWCGNTFKEFKQLGGKASLIYHSYWDGEGDGEVKFEPGAAPILLEDQLPLSLRSLNFKEGVSFKMKVLETLITSKVRKPAPVDAEISVRGKESVDAAGKKIQTWKVAVKLTEGKENVYWVEAAYPNLLVKQTTWDGRNMTLKSVTRDDYWVIKTASK